MADIYDRAKALAARMLAPRSSGGKGLALTLTKITPGSYNPATGTSTNTSTNYSGSGLRQDYDLSDIDGSMIRQGDVKFLISPTLINGNDTPEPAAGDSVTFDGSTYSVVSVSPWNYAGVSVGFSVQARK